MKKIITLAILFVSMFSFSFNAHAASPSLSSSRAKEIAVKGNQHFWNALSGHIPGTKDSKCPSSSFSYKGKDYRYFCSELDTKKEFVSYMNQVYTLNAINKGIEKYRFIEYKGKFAQPNADGGSVLQWSSSSAKLIYQKKNVRQFEFTVPTGEKGKTVKKKVTFFYYKNNWLINDMDAAR